MFGFNKQRIIAAIVKLLNSNLDYIAERDGYFTTDDIEDIETWWIGIRICFKRGTFRRYLMVSKTKVCAKLAPSKQEVTFHRMGNSVSDRLHLSTYCYRWDDLNTWHIWTVSIGYSTLSQARAFADYLWENNLCAHSIIRTQHRTSCKFELKVWGLDPDVLDKLINGVIDLGKRLEKWAELSDPIDMSQLGTDPSNKGASGCAGSPRKEAAFPPIFTSPDAWHEVCKQQISKLGIANKHNYKPKGWQTEYSPPQPHKLLPIRVIKPNGAYRFMQGENMLVAVYTKEEVAIKVKEYLMDDYVVEFEDSTTGMVYKAMIVNGKLKYEPITRTA